MDTFAKTTVEIMKLTKLLRFLIEFAYFNEDQLMTRSAQPRPEDQIVYDYELNSEVDGYIFK